MKADVSGSTATRFCPKRRSDLNVRVIDGETVVLDRDGGFVHQFNPAASFIWNQCDGQMTIDKIARRLVKIYEVELQVATKDVTETLQTLHKLNLVE